MFYLFEILLITLNIKLGFRSTTTKKQQANKGPAQRGALAALGYATLHIAGYETLWPQIEALNLRPSFANMLPS